MCLFCFSFTNTVKYRLPTVFCNCVGILLYHVIMSYTVDKCDIENALRELVANYLELSIPYMRHLEFHGVLGIKLDEVQELFVCLNKTIIKHGHVVPIQEQGSLVKQELRINDDVQETTEVVVAGVTGDNYQTWMTLLQEEDGLEMSTSTESVVAVHNYAQAAPSHLKSVDDVTTSPSNGSDQGPDVTNNDRLLADIDNEVDIDQISNADFVLKSGCVPTTTANTKPKSRTQFIYKPTKEHLDNPTCECCEVLDRYRQKDRDVAARKRAIIRGRPAPPYKSSKNKIIYKLPYGHVNSCMCCTMLAARRDSMNRMVRNKRIRQYALRDVKSMKKLYDSSAPTTSVFSTPAQDNTSDDIGHANTQITKTTDMLNSEVSDECNELTVNEEVMSTSKHIENAPCECCEVLHRFNVKILIAKQRRIAKKRGEPIPSLPIQESRAEYYQLPSDHKDVCSCCLKLTDLRNRPGKN